FPICDSYFKPVQILFSIHCFFANEFPRLFANLEVRSDLSFAWFDELCFDADIPDEILFAEAVDARKHEKWVSHRQHGATEGSSDQVSSEEIWFMSHNGS